MSDTEEEEQYFLPTHFSGVVSLIKWTLRHEDGEADEESESIEESCLAKWRKQQIRKR